MNILVILLLLLLPLCAAPTQSRIWKSTAGSKIEASAIEKKGDQIVLKLKTGKIMTVPISKLSPADQKFLAKHFSAQASTAKAPTDLPHPMGKNIGPIKVENSNYFLYLPTSLVADQKAPLLFFTGSGGGNPGMIKRYTEAAEVCGWIIAISKEVKNGMNGMPHIKRCMAHIKETLPIDESRLYFTGPSGGGARALHNAAHFTGAGAMPLIAHGVWDKAPPSKGAYYFIGGATDFNRYGTAACRKGLGKSAFHRFHPGSHSTGPISLVNDGMLWMNARFFERQAKGDYAEAQQQFERRFLTMISELPEDQAHRAYMLLSYLMEDYDLHSDHQSEAKQLQEKLAQKGDSIRYLEALKDLDKLSQGPLSDLGVGTRNKHTSAKVTRAAKKLLEKYPALHEIPQICTNLQKPTG